MKKVLYEELCPKEFEERLEEYDGKISICDFDWGEPVGRETGDNV